MACYLLYVEHLSITKICSIFGENIMQKLKPFRDAGIGPSDYPLTMKDILKGL